MNNKSFNFYSQKFLRQSYCLPGTCLGRWSRPCAWGPLAGPARPPCPRRAPSHGRSPGWCWAGGQWWWLCWKRWYQLSDEKFGKWVTSKVYLEFITTHWLLVIFLQFLEAELFCYFILYIQRRIWGGKRGFLRPGGDLPPTEDLGGYDPPPE